MSEPPKAMRVEDVLRLTQDARSWPPSGDQAQVLVADGADPWIIRHGGRYYNCTRNELGDRRKILVSCFDDLRQLAAAPLVEVWPLGEANVPETVAGYVEVWAPELQIIDGRPYIYATLYMGNDEGEGGPRERIHCFEGMTGDPLGPFAYKGAMKVTTDRWAIDGSVMEIDGARYFIWSGWDGHVNHSQNLYIAAMSDPWTLASDRVCISKPQYDWEKVGYPYVNEGPQALVHDGHTFIIYSASGSWTDAYCLGQLTYLGGDPLDAAAWRKEPQPVFHSTDTIFGVGHACFVRDAGGTEWIVYHAARASGAAWARQVRAKRFTWKADGAPDFGLPL